MLALLMFWSSAVLAVWCDDDATHWIHIDAEQAWLQSSTVHNDHQHCALPTGLSPSKVQAIIYPADEDTIDSPDSDPPFTAQETAQRFIQLGNTWSGSAQPLAVLTPPLYLIYQRLLLPFSA